MFPSIPRFVSGSTDGGIESKGPTSSPVTTPIPLCDEEEEREKEESSAVYPKPLTDMHSLLVNKIMKLKSR